jgi:hypothetical protein
MMDDVFSHIDVQLIAAGCLGGLVHALNADKEQTPRQIVSYIVTGGIAANFIAPQAFNLLAMFPMYFIAFGIGMSGKYLCWCVEMFFNKLGMSGKTENE